MITSDGLLYIQRKLIQSDLCVALYYNDIECSFPGYTRLVLNPEKWMLNERGNIVQEGLIFALHSKELTYINKMQVIALDTNEIIYVDNIEVPYILRYQDDFINYTLELNITRM